LLCKFRSPKDHSTASPCLILALLTVSSPSFFSLLVSVPRLTVQEDRILGRSQFGVVGRTYRRRDEQFFVWCKALLEDHQLSGELSELVEATSHVPVIDSGFLQKYVGIVRDENVCCILLEYCHGETLDILLAKRQSQRQMFTDDV
jgi:hypothetical protein